jgi:hypothetical protein
MLNTMVDLRRVVLSTVAVGVLMSAALANVTAARPPQSRHFWPVAVFRVPSYGDSGPSCGIGGIGEPVEDAQAGDPSSWLTVWVCKKGHGATRVMDPHSRLAAL